MQRKETVYLAGKITGDPYYFTKFYNAQKKLEEGGFIVVNPALLPAEGFTWEAYMRMSGAMLAECAEVCFLPDVFMASHQFLVYLSHSLPPSFTAYFASIPFFRKN